MLNKSIEGPWLGSGDIKPKENIQQRDSQALPFSVLTVPLHLFYLLCPYSKQAKLQFEMWNFRSTMTLHFHKASYSPCSVLNTLEESKHPAGEYKAISNYVCASRFLVYLCFTLEHFLLYIHRHFPDTPNSMNKKESLNK